MAQKTLARETPRTGLRKSHKIVDVTLNTSQSADKQYPEVNAAIDRGLADVASGRVHTRRSYAEYADIEIEE